jgi:hypothetical protein
MTLVTIILLLVAAGLFGYAWIRARQHQQELEREEERQQVDERIAAANGRPYAGPLEVTPIGRKSPR